MNEKDQFSIPLVFATAGVNDRGRFRRGIYKKSLRITELVYGWIRLIKKMLEKRLLWKEVEFRKNRSCWKSDSKFLLSPVLALPSDLFSWRSPLAYRYRGNASRRTPSPVPWAARWWTSFECGVVSVFPGWSRRRDCVGTSCRADSTDACLENTANLHLRLSASDDQAWGSSRNRL